MSTVTLDGSAGPGLEFQALVINDVSSIRFEPAAGMLFLTVNSVEQSYDISTAATITVTVSGENYTVTIAD